MLGLCWGAKLAEKDMCASWYDYQWVEMISWADHYNNNANSINNKKSSYKKVNKKWCSVRLLNELPKKIIFNDISLSIKNHRSTTKYLL